MLQLSDKTSAQFPGIPIPVGGVGVGVGVGVPDVLQQFYGYPNPYANKAVSYQSTYLYKYSELSDDSLGRIIYGMAFKVSDAQASLLRNFTISIAEVNYDEIPEGSINASFKVVYARAGYVEFNGINTHIFDKPYCLENASNILVKVCVQNFTDERSNNAGVVANIPDSTKFSSYHDWSNDPLDLCSSMTSNAKRYKERPITYFYQNPITTVDLQVISVDQPASIELIDAVITPTFSFRNYSCESIDNYTVNYQVNDEPIQTEVPNIVLGRNDILNHTFSLPITLDKEGFQVIKFWTSSPDDTFYVNDTIQRLVWVRKSEFEGLDYSGTDFWVGFMKNYTNNNTLVQEIFVTSVDATAVTIEMPYLGWSTTLNLNAQDVQKVQIPVNYGGYVVANDKPGLPQPVGIHVTSVKEISVYGLSNSYQSSDGFLGIPSPSLGREYFALAPIGTYFPLSIPGSVVDETPAQILLIATENATNAKVVLSNPANGLNKGDTINVNLNAGETFLIQAATIRTSGIPTGGYDLTGSKIISDKKIGVVGGAQCALIPGIDEPDACQYCDHIMEQLTPSTAWGNVYYFTDYDFKPGEDILRIVSGTKGITTVDAGGTVYQLNGEGDFIDHRFVGGIRVQASNPVQVVQMCTGGRCAPTSGTDPFYINGVPIEQWGGNYNFSTVVSKNFPFHFVNILKRAKDSRVAIDGNLIHSSLFEKIPNTDIYSYKKQISAGAHLITGDTNIFVSVYGFGRDDAYGYPASGAKLKPIQVQEPEITSITFDVPCFGDTTGAIEVGGLLGTPPYQFLWDDGFVGPIRTGLKAGSYVVTLIDDYGYTAKDSIVIKEADLITTSISKGDVTCFDYTDGWATFEANRDTLKSILWSTQENTYEISNLDTGWYYLNIQDTAGCAAVDSVHIAQPSKIAVSFNLQQQSCSGRKDAKLNLRISGGVNPYNVSVFQNGNAIDTTLLNFGDFNIHVTDNQGCTLDTVISIEKRKAIVVDIAVKQPGCGTDKNGVIDFSKVYNAQGNLKFYFNNSLTTKTKWENLGAANYAITVKDSKGCSWDTIIGLKNYPVPKFTWDLSPDSCEKSIGEIRINGTSGTGSYKVKWADKTDTTSNLTRVDLLGGRTYTFYASDTYCGAEYSFTTPIAGGIDFEATVQNTTCGENNGQISLKVLSGSGVFTIAPSYPISGKVIKNLPPDVYTITYSSSTCMVTKQVEVKAIPVLTIDSIAISPRFCETLNGFAQVFASNNTGYIKYAWSNGVNSYRIQDLDSGYYTLSIHDDYCTLDTSIYVPYHAKPAIEVEFNNPLCGADNGLIEVKQLNDDDITVTWAHNPSLQALKADSLKAGEYTLEVKNDYCSAVFTKQLVDTVSFTASSIITPEHCSLSDGSIALNIVAEGGVQIKWINSSISGDRVDSLMSGTYAVELSDEFCVDTLNLVVPFSAGPSFTSTIVPAKCNESNGTITINAQSNTGDLYYYLNTIAQPNNVFQNLSPGKYLVSVSDGFCTISDSILVDSISAINYTLHVINETCSAANAVVEVMVESGINYSIQWEMGDNTLSPNIKTEGNYPFIITDDYCTQKDTVIVTNLAKPIITVQSFSPTMCNEDNGGLNITVSGPEAPYTIYWGDPTLDNQTSLTQLKDSTYKVLVTGSVCKDSLSFTIPKIPLFKVETTLVKNVDCDVASGEIAFTYTNNANPITITASGTNYTQPAKISGLDVGYFYFTATDGICTINDSVYVPKGEDLKFSTTYTDETCAFKNGSIQVSFVSNSSMVTINWDDVNAGFTRSNLAANTYNFTITDSLCQKQGTVTLINHKAPSGNLIVKQRESCQKNDGIIYLKDIQNTDSWTWSNGSSNINPLTGLTKGNYSVMLTNAYCTVVKQVILDKMPLPILNYQKVDNYCNNSTGQVIFTPTVASESNIYVITQIPDTSVVASNKVKGLPTGNYLFVLRDAFGCTDTISAQIIDISIPKPAAKIYVNPSPLVLSAYGEVYTNVTSPWFVDSWKINNTMYYGEQPKFIVDSLLYTVQLNLKHTFGCTDTVILNNIQVDDEGFYVPNTFTPDGDGYNEFYGPICSGIESWEGLIFDRWGELIYIINQDQKTWDGTYKGKPVKSDMYVVKYRYKPRNGHYKSFHTHINLLR